MPHGGLDGPLLYQDGLGSRESVALQSRLRDDALVWMDNKAFKNDETEAETTTKTPAGTRATGTDFSTSRILPQFIAASAATLGSMSMGLNLGWSSPVQPQLVNLTENRPDSLVLNQEEWSWVASLLTLGALVGGLVGGTLIDFLGRKSTLILASLPFIVGWLLTVTAVHPMMLYFGRVLNGVGGGLCSVATPIYIAELSTPAIRGRLGVLYQMSLVTGVWFSSAIGVGLDDGSAEEWRWISIICAFFPLFLAIAMIFVPESPYWLLRKGRKEDARKAMQWSRGPNYQIDPEIIQLEASIKAQKATAGRLSDLLGWWAMKPFLVAMGLMLFQQMCGTNNILFYMAVMFQEAGSDLPPLISSLICSSVKITVAVVSIVLVDKAGRRILLLTSTILTTVGMTALGTYFYLDHNNPEMAASLRWLPLASIIVFIAGFDVGLGSLPWLMMSEILPRKVKGPATSIAATFNWGLSFVVTKTFVSMQMSLTTAGAYWLFGSFCFLGVIFVAAFVPETKGKTYEEIQAHFGNYENATPVDTYDDKKINKF